MSTFEERRAARIERLHRAAERAEQDAHNHSQTASKMASIIPMGQPILIGHHSEGADRRYRARIDKQYQKANERFNDATNYRARADAAENNTAIFSDDNSSIIKYTLKNELSSEEIDYVYMELFGLRIEECQKIRERHVLLMLSEAISGSEIERGTGLLLSTIKEKLSETSREEISTRCRTIKKNTHASNKNLRKQMCLLRRDNIRVSNSGSHQQRWSKSSEDNTRIKNNSRCFETGMSKKQISSAVLQLQLRKRTLGLLSTSKIIYGIPPDNLLPYFTIIKTNSAAEKLEVKIERLEKCQALMVAANKLVRKGDREELLKLGFDQYSIDRLFKEDFCGRVGFPDYQLTNNGANIRRLKQRLQTVEAKADVETSEEVIGDVRVVQNIEDNRLQLFFPGKPDESIKTQLKRNGFHWSPYNGCWQRLLSNGAIYAAKQILTP